MSPDLSPDLHARSSERAVEEDRALEDRSVTSAPVLEVFASVQGEGWYVGEPQVFLRLSGCPLRCRWCDTPGSWAVPDEPRARVAAVDGPRREDGWVVSG